MTRVYVRTHVGLMDDEDYAALSTTGKAGWHTVNMLQGKQTEERFKNRQQVAILLRREGFEDPAAVLQELEANRWIVDDPDGGISLKGYSKWQAVKRNQYMQEYRALRNSNEQARAESSHVPSRPFTSRPVPSRPMATPHDGPHDDCKREDAHVHVS